MNYCYATPNRTLSRWPMVVWIAAIWGFLGAVDSPEPRAQTGGEGRADVRPGQGKRERPVRAPAARRSSTGIE